MLDALPGVVVGALFFIVLIAIAVAGGDHRSGWIEGWYGSRLCENSTAF